MILIRYSAWLSLILASYIKYFLRYKMVHQPTFRPFFEAMFEQEDHKYN